MSAKPSLVVMAFLSILVGAAAERVIAAPSAADANQVESWAEAKWPSLGGDYARSGQSPNQGPIELDVKWMFETGGAVVSSVTVASEGQIHVACEDGKLYALDGDGRSLWILDVNSALLSAPSIGPDGSLFVGSQDGKLYAIDPNGRLRWTQDTAGAIYASPAVGANGSVYVGSTDGTFYAFDRDGTELWQFRTKGPGRRDNGAIFASPSIAADGTVHVAGLYDPNLYALDPENGNSMWVCQFESGGWPFASPVVGKDGAIYQTLLYDSHLYAIEPNDGTILWSADLADIKPAKRGSTIDAEDSDGWSEPVIGPDGTIYVSLDDPYLRAVDPNGSITWVTRLGDVGAFTLTVDKTGLIYAAGDDGSIYVVDSSGSLLNRLDTGGWPAFPVIAADNTLIVTDSRDYSVLITDAKNAVWAIGQEP